MNIRRITQTIASRMPAQPPTTRKHTEERLKLLAGGLQLLALALFGAGLIAPLFNPSLVSPIWEKALTLAAAISAEVAAITLLKYIPFPKDA